MLKLEAVKKNDDTFKLNEKLISKYFGELNDPKSTKFINFESYFSKFFNFCFELPLDNMIRETIKFITSAYPVSR